MLQYKIKNIFALSIKKIAILRKVFHKKTYMPDILNFSVSYVVVSFSAISTIELKLVY